MIFLVAFWFVFGYQIMATDQEKKNNLPNSSYPSSSNILVITISNALYLLLVPLQCIVLTHLSTLTVDDFFELYGTSSGSTLGYCFYAWFLFRPREVYLVNFACYKPDNPSQMCSGKLFMQIASKTGIFLKETLSF
ncbi:hypothetical protein CUMW_153690 [Citrus unshiu]|uniref:Uncharacterized protein n=1 Tax=Citrus unshiu TaxID=55188 RepID=A0A2H5PNV9_CITUN|nr:hypothetical protein CUMW_153690 [Citrus unshiu]